MQSSITTSLCPDAPPSQPERRGWVRYPAQLRGVCKPTAHSLSLAYWPVTIVDCSAGGVSLLLNRRFEPGSCLMLELPETADTTLRTLLTQVVRVEPRPFERWLLGCVFKWKLDEEELLALLRYPWKSAG